MADCLANLKERLHLNHVAYASPTGLVDSNSIRVGVSDIFVAKYKSTDQETLTRFQSSIDQLITLVAEYHGRDQGWHTRDEWVEACCWFLLKRPRVFKAKWSGWFGSAFDVMDEDHDGYISEDEISFFYQLTCRANDKAWISRAFKSMDLDNSGKISREKYVSTYIRYFTDPDASYDEVPLF